MITQARAAGLVTKSNLILGLGEERAEVSQALRDLHAAGCELITITQYLRPTPRHHPVERWVKPEEFVELREEAEEIGFVGRDERAAGALLLPRRPALPAGHRRPRGRRRLTAHPHAGPTRPAPIWASRSRARRWGQRVAVSASSPSRCATAAASTRLATASFAMIRETCTLAVFGEM